MSKTSLRGIDNVLSHILWTVLRIVKPSPRGRRLLYAAHKHIDSRPVGTRRLMMLTSIASPLTNQKNVHELSTYPTTHLPLCLSLIFSWKPSGSVSLLSTSCPGLFSWHPAVNLFGVCRCVCVCVCVCVLSSVWLFVTPWTLLPARFLCP